MVDKDMDLLFGEMPKFSINGKECSLKDLDVEQHLMAEYNAQQIDQTLKQPLTEPKDAKALSKKIREYIGLVFEISPAEASKVRFTDYKRLRKWMDRRDLYDQGFNDSEIDRLEKEATTKSFQKALREGT